VAFYTAPLLSFFFL